MTTSRFDVNAERDYWNQRDATRELIWTAEANCFVAEEVSTLRLGRALDLAAGEGRNAVLLAERPGKTDSGGQVALDCVVRGTRHG